MLLSLSTSTSNHYLPPDHDHVICEWGIIRHSAAVIHDP
jgi:hypothetical protein